MDIKINHALLLTNSEIESLIHLCIIALPIFLIFLAWVIKHDENIKQQRKRIYDVPYDNHNKEYFITQAKEITLSILKTPAVAQFNSIEVKCMDSQKRVYVETVVDSQNGFGAYVRSTYGILFVPNIDNALYKHFIQEINTPYQVTNFKMQHGWNMGIPNISK